MAWRLIPPSAPSMSHGSSPRRQQGANQEEKQSMVGGSGTCGAQMCQDGHGKIGNVHAQAASMARVVLWRETPATISPCKPILRYPLTTLDRKKGTSRAQLDLCPFYGGRKRLFMV